MKDTNYKLICDLFEKHKGEIVICDGDYKLYRLIGIIDGRHDYYWMYFDGHQISFHSCVGDFIPLLGKIDDKDYIRLVERFKYGHVDYMVEEPFAIRQQFLSERMGKEDKLMAEVCWDIKELENE